MTLTTDAELRRGLGNLNQQAAGDLHRLWRQVATAAEAQVALNDVLPALIEEYGMAAASMAAEWYDEARIKAGIAGTFTAVVARADDMGAESLIGWAAKSASSMDTMLPLVQGGLVKRLTLVTARTIGGSAVADRGAKGWQRVAHGECSSGFCNMLAGRGAVYTEKSVDFAAHDNCQCTATVAWKGRAVPVRPYVPSSRNISDADRARVGRYLRSH